MRVRSGLIGYQWMRGGGGGMRLANCADEVLEHCEVCRSFNKAPHVSMRSGKLQVDLPYSGDLIALRAMDVYRKHSPLIAARSRNPQEAWGASRSAWVGVFRRPMCVRGDQGGDWKNKIRPVRCSWRSTSTKFQGAGERHWIPECRNGLARVFSYRLEPDGRFPGAQPPSGVQ